MGAPIFSRSNQHASETQPQSQPTQDMTDSPDLLLEELDHEDNVEVLLESLEGASGGIGKNLEALKSTLGKADITGGDIDDNWYQLIPAKFAFLDQLVLDQTLKYLYRGQI